MSAYMHRHSRSEVSSSRFVSALPRPLPPPLPPPIIDDNMAYSAQQWQWFLQQSLNQMHPPQSTLPRQQAEGAQAVKDNWWAEDAERAWASASRAAMRASPHMAGHKQAQQHTNYRNVPWFRKKEMGDQSPPPALRHHSLFQYRHKKAQQPQHHRTPSHISP